MALGLAAIMSSGEEIGVLSDWTRPFGGGRSGNDSIAKTYGLFKNWGIVFSGDNEPGLILTVIRDMRARAAKFGAPCTLAEARSITRDACRAAFFDDIVAKHLVFYGFDEMREFQQHGLERLGAEEYSRVIRAIRESPLDLDFLVYGFGPHGGAHIFSVSGNGAIRDCDIIGYGAVGRAGEAACTSMATARFSEHDRATDLYRLCVAKFSTEATQRVAEGTTLCIFTKDFEFHEVPEPEIASLRAIFETSRLSAIPGAAQHLIDARFAALDRRSST